MTLKSTFLASCLLTFTCNVIAQPTLTANTSLPVPGLTYLYYEVNAGSPVGASGANVSWDYSTMSFPNSPSTINYFACNTAANCSAFPGSNLVEINSSSSGYGYYVANSMALSVNGFSSGTASGDLIYGNPEDILRFPVAYNTSYIDQWSATVQNAGVAFFRKGIDSIKADGWGTLKTPAGTYSNALRIKDVQTYRDSANFGGQVLIIDYRTIIYVWYDAAHKDFLYTTNTVTVNNNGSVSTTNSSVYTKNQMLDVANTHTRSEDWKVFPNPARENVQVSLSLNAAAAVSLQLIDFSGRLVCQVPDTRLAAGENKMIFPLANVAAGTYILKLTSNSYSTFKKVVVAP